MPNHLSIQGFRLSAQQKRVWDSQNNGVVNCTRCRVKLRGPIDAMRLQRAIERVIARHDILRSHFMRIAGNRMGLQRVEEEIEIAWWFSDVRRGRILLDEEWKNERYPGFHLEAGATLKVRVIRMNDDHHELWLTMPVLCADGESMHRLVEEISLAYGGVLPSTHEVTQYAQYGEWQQQIIQEPEAEKGARYWDQILSSKAVGWHYGWQDNDNQSQGREVINCEVEPEILNQLQKISEACDKPLQSIVLACWEILLWFCNDRVSPIVWQWFSGRAHEELQSIQGLMGRYLPIMVDLQPGMKLKEILEDLQRQSEEIVTWQEFWPETDEKPGAAETNMSEAIQFEYQELQKWNQGGVSFEVEKVDSDVENGRIKLRWVGCHQGRVNAELHYNPRYCMEPYMVRIMQYFRELLNSIAKEGAEAAIGDLSLLSIHERQKLLDNFQASQWKYTQEKCLHEFLSEAAQRTPHSVAVKSGQETLTFTELEKQSNQWGRYLRRLGVTAETLIGLAMKRTPQMIAAILGVLKSGGAYVPLDTSYPVERLRYIVEDSKAALVIGDEGDGDWLAGVETNWIRVGKEEAAKIAQESVEDLKANVSAGNLAYVIYTSGSTGRPKGVMITHRGVVNYLSWAATAYGKSTRGMNTTADTDVESEGSIVHTPLGFDLTVTSLYVPWLQGKAVELIQEEGPGQIEHLSAMLMSGKRFGLLKATPRHISLLTELLEPGKIRGAVQAIVIGGEALYAGDLEWWLQNTPGTRFINEYGPTETVVGCCVYELEAGMESKGAVPIGRPVANARIYVLDEKLNLVPLGAKGEIYIGGEGVGRGYWGRPDLTAERFISDPYACEPGARMYKTGDLGRWQDNGVLHYLGRNDGQVKVRGYRIELGEVESALRQYPGVCDAIVVLDQGQSQNQRLVGYYLQTSGTGPIPLKDFQDYLKQWLPDFMVPAAFVQLEHFPLTPNGKIDHKALPAPVDRHNPVSFVPPEGRVAEILAEIWSTVLAIHRVGANDNYFALGGDSIRSVRVLALAKERGLSFSLDEIFKFQTIAELAKHVKIGGAPETQASSAPFSLVSDADRAMIPDDIEDAYPLSRLQMGMLYHMYVNPDRPSYHNVCSYHVRGHIDSKLIQEAARRVVMRHPVFRTSFEFTKFSQPMQLVHKQAELPVPIIDWRDLSTDEIEHRIQAFIADEWNHLFDMSRPPLIRFHIHLRTDNTFQFTLTECHAVVDGWSITSTFAELFNIHMELLADPQTPPKPPPSVLFRDFIAEERRAIESKESRRYWAEKLKDSVPLKLPRFKVLPQSHSGPRIRVLRVPVSPELESSLRKVAESLSVSLKSVFLAVHIKLMSILAGTSDVLTGLGTHARPETLDGEQVRGLFLNTVPFRLKVKDNRWADLVQETFHNEIEFLPHRAYPFADLQREAGQSALLETEFHYLHFHSVQEIMTSGGIEVIENSDVSETNFVLQVGLQLGPVTSAILLELLCDKTQLADEQMELMAHYYGLALQTIAQNPFAMHSAVSSITSFSRDMEDLALRQEQKQNESLQQTAMRKLSSARRRHVVVNQ